MRTRASVLIYNQQTREVLLIRNFHGDHQYYLIPGGVVQNQELPILTVVRNLVDELQITLRPEQLQDLGVFDYQGNPQYCYVLDCMQHHLPSCNYGTTKYMSEWVLFNDLENKLDYMPQIVDQFFKQLLVGA